MSLAQCDNDMAAKYLLCYTVLVYAGEPPRRAGKYVPKFLPPSMAAVLGASESKPNVMEVAS